VRADRRGSALIDPKIAEHNGRLVKTTGDEGRHYGSIFGTVMLAAILGGAAGPWMAGVLYDATGAYSIAFWIATGCSAISIGIWLAAPGKVRAVAGRAGKLATG
jgi:MFS family permease